MWESGELAEDEDLDRKEPGIIDVLDEERACCEGNDECDAGGVSDD